MFESLTPWEVSTLTPAELLDYASAADRARQQAEAAIVAAASAWGRAHRELTGASGGLPGVERLVQVGGDGAPAVADLAIAEFGAVLGLTSGSARMLIADALDLTHRLPAVWTRVQAGEVPVWKARRVAERTRGLPLVSVVSVVRVVRVDKQIAAFAGTLPMSRLDRVVRSALIDAEPDEARTEAERAAEQRGVWVGEHGDDGNTDILIRTDTATAVRFDALLNQIAQTLTDGEATLTRDQRRALAVGVLGHSTQPTPATLYVHIDGSTLSASAHVARIEGAAGPLPAEQVREWLRRCDVTVKPVVNLAGQVPVDNWETPLRLREATFLRTPVDTFPWSGSTSRTMDLDHTVPYDPGGPPGQTRSDNLAPLTRYHHRVKTHGGWQVRQPFDGVLVWKSPHGHHFMIDHRGTHA